MGLEPLGLCTVCGDQGHTETQKHRVYVPLFLIIPAILVALNYKTYLFASGLSFVCLCIGYGVGFVLGKATPITILRASKSVELPGNYHTFFVLVSVFVIQYTFGYLSATAPEIALRYVELRASISA